MAEAPFSLLPHQKALFHPRDLFNGLLTSSPHQCRSLWVTTSPTQPEHFVSKKNRFLIKIFCTYSIPHLAPLHSLRSYLAFIRRCGDSNKQDHAVSLHSRSLRCNARPGPHPLVRCTKLAQLGTGLCPQFSSPLSMGVDTIFFEDTNVSTVISLLVLFCLPDLFYSSSYGDTPSPCPSVPTSPRRCSLSVHFFQHALLLVQLSKSCVHW